MINEKLKKGSLIKGRLTGSIAILLEFDRKISLYNGSENVYFVFLIRANKKRFASKNFEIQKWLEGDFEDFDKK